MAKQPTNTGKKGEGVKNDTSPTENTQPTGATTSAENTTTAADTSGAEKSSENDQNNASDSTSAGATTNTATAGDEKSPEVTPEVAGDQSAEKSSEGDKNTENTATDHAPAKTPVKEKPMPKQLMVLADSINKLFADRDKTSLPKITEADVMKHAANAAVGIDIQFNYSNDERTSGYIIVKEFEYSIRCPQEGEFKFGIDYSKGR